MSTTEIDGLVACAMTLPAVGHVMALALSLLRGWAAEVRVACYVFSWGRWGYPTS
jgi:hypothetical protein